MEHQPWICPSCNRRLPRWIYECRCGFQRDPEDPVEAGQGPAVNATATSRARLFAGGIVLAVTVSAALWWNGHPSGVSLTPPTRAPVEASQRLADGPIAVRDTALTTDFARLAPVAAEEFEPAPVRPIAAPAPLEDVISDVLPAVVSITAGQARGTGFFIKVDTILTNAHVVGGQSVVQLTLGKTTSSARIVSVNPAVDLAVLQIANPDPRQRTLRLGSVDGVRVGEEVVAVGSALGVLSNTVTRGIVSAVRQAGAVTLIQTDAAINPGNSGGPLVNRAGQVIGINSIGVSKQAGEGLAFAVAIDHALPMVAGGAPAGIASTATPTPISSLQQQMTGSTSDSDATRDRGERTFADAMVAAGRAADAIDDYWNRYSGDCVTKSTRGGDRAWFAALEPGAVDVGQSLKWDCANWIDTVRGRAAELRTRIQQASEAARHDGVYPGVIREMRRRSRLEWSGW